MDELSTFIFAELCYLALGKGGCSVLSSDDLSSESGPANIGTYAAVAFAGTYKISVLCLQALMLRVASQTPTTDVETA
jgi:hypothetical protein